MRAVVADKAPAGIPAVLVACYYARYSIS